MAKIFRGGVRITQGFGENPEFYKMLGGHEGIDMVIADKNNKDWSVLVPLPGIVLVDQDAIRDVYGLNVVIYHWDINQVWYYCHLQINTISAHDIVKEGQIIGTMGGTSTATGMDEQGNKLDRMPAHLHVMGYRCGRNVWERRDRDKGFAGMIDILPIMREKGIV